MIGEEPVDHPLKAVKLLQQKFGRKMKPVEVPASQAVSQPEHRRGRQDRHPPVPGAADVAARRRHVSRHQRRRHHHGPGDRPGERRHLPDDDQGAARDRRLHLARQGRRRRPRQVVEDGQAGADRGGLRHRPAAVPGRRDDAAEDRERVRILLRHQGLADRAVHLRPHRPAAAGARRDHPRRPSLSGRHLRRRPVRRVHRLLRPAERRDAVHARRAAALPQQSDADLRADGGRPVERVRAVLGGGALRRHLGRPDQARHPGHPGRVVDPGGGRLGHDGRLDQADVCRPCRAGDGARRAMHRRRLFRQVRHRGRRRHRPEQHRPGAVGDGDAVAAGAVDRHPARDLEHVPRSEPEPAGDPAVGLEGADQRLHGLQAHQDLLAAHQARQEDLRPGGVALERAGLFRQGAGDHGVRGQGFAKRRERGDTA